MVLTETDPLRRQLAGGPLAPLASGLDDVSQTRAAHRLRHPPDADIDAPEAWTVTRGPSTTVAVIDAGIRHQPPRSCRDLPSRPRLRRRRQRAPARRQQPRTHVAGTITAAANVVGTIAVAPQARSMPAAVLDDSGDGWGSDVAATASPRPATHGVRVVDAWLGSGSVTRPEPQTMPASRPGTLYVVAARRLEPQRREHAAVPLRLRRGERPVRRRDQLQRQGRQLSRTTAPPTSTCFAPVLRWMRLDPAARPRQATYTSTATASCRGGR